MSDEDFKVFLKDYNLLMNVKGTDIWKEAKKLTDDVFKLSLFDKLNNKYNYIEYRYLIRTDVVIHEKIEQGIIKYDLHIGSCMMLHYTIEIYIAFMIEYIIKQEIEKRTGIKAYSSKELDTEQKTDILCGKNHYQIKNYSFIESNYSIDNRIDEYKKVNSNLIFIFYKLNKDSIDIVSINNKPFLYINEINAFTVFEPYEKLDIDSLIKEVEAIAA